MVRSLLPALLSLLLAPPLFAIATGDPATPQAAPLTDKQWFGMHSHLVALVRQAASKTPLQIYFLGDSITEFWPVVGKDTWQKEFGKYNVVNCGLRGDTTQNILYRILNGEFEHVHPQIIVLMGGINNLGLDESLAPADLSRGLRKIVTALRAKSPFSKIILVSILPSGASPDNPVRKRIRDTNALLAKIADNKSVFFLDIYDRFLDAKGYYNADISADELHPTAKGYAIWAEAMRPLLLQIFEDRPAAN